MIKSKILGRSVAMAVLTLVLLSNAGLAADKLSALYSAQSISYSMPWIAKELGLFRKYKLDVDLVYIPSSGVANAADPS